jgi:hypothetical protein
MLCDLCDTVFSWTRFFPGNETAPVWTCPFNSQLFPRSVRACRVT